MNRFILSIVCVCLVIANNVDWGVSGIEGDSVNNLIDKTYNLDNKNLNSNFGPNLSSNAFPAGTLPAINEGERLLKEKCYNISKSNETYNTILEAKDSLETCVSSLFNITEIKQKIDVARPVGDVDVVFKEYCKKSPHFKACMLNYTATLDVCLEESEKESKIIVQNVTEALLTFVCHDEGDRIALFYSEGGPDCLEDKKEAIEHCVNKSFGKYNPSGDGQNVSSTLPSFKFEEEQCKSLAELQECVVNELKNCGQPTPANIVESLFHFICQTTPCKNFKCNKRSGGVSLQPTIFITALGSLSILLGRINY